MSILDDYGIDAPIAELPLLILKFTESSDMTELKIHKIVRYYQYLIKKDIVEFSYFKRGVVSYELQESLDELCYMDLVDREKNKYVTNYYMTDKGESISRELLEKYDESDITHLKFSVERFKNLSDDEVMYIMYKLIPDSQRYSIHISRLEKNRYNLVKNIYMKGKISTYTAAKWLNKTEKEIEEAFK